MFEDAEFRDEVDNPWVEEGYDRLYHNYVSLIKMLNLSQNMKMPNRQRISKRPSI